MLSKRRYTQQPDYTHFREIEDDKTIPALIVVCFETLVLYKGVEPCMDHLFQDFLNKLSRLSSDQDYQIVGYVQEKLREIYMSQNIKELDNLIHQIHFQNYLSTLFNNLPEAESPKIKRVCSYFSVNLLFYQNESLKKFYSPRGIKCILRKNDNLSFFYYLKLSKYSSFSIPQAAPISQSIMFCSQAHPNCNCSTFSIERDNQTQETYNSNEFCNVKCSVCELFEGKIRLENYLVCCECLICLIFNKKYAKMYIEQDFDLECRLSLIQEASNFSKIKYQGICVVCFLKKRVSASVCAKIVFEITTGTTSIACFVKKGSITARKVSTFHTLGLVNIVKIV